MAGGYLVTVLIGIMGLPDLAFLGGIGSTEIIMILVVMLLLFGPKQFPDLAKTIGNALRGIRKATDDMKEEIGFDDIVNPRGQRPRAVRPRRNNPGSLRQSEGSQSATKQISEGDADDEQPSNLVPADSLPAQQNQATVPPEAVTAEPPIKEEPASADEPVVEDGPAAKDKPAVKDKPVVKDEPVVEMESPTPVSTEDSES